MSYCFAEMRTELQNELNAFASVQGQPVTALFVVPPAHYQKEMTEFQTVEPMHS